MKIHKGDTVAVRTGKDRGKRGTVIRVLPHDLRVVVEGLNLRKKHRRAKRQDRKGEIMLIPAPFAVSAVMLVCSGCGKATKAGYRRNPSGEKIRVCRRCGKTLT